MSKIYYCPYCGQTYNFTILNSSICQNCLTENIEFNISKYDSSYYRKMSIEKFGNILHANDILYEEISKNPLFDIEKSKITRLEDKESEHISKLISKNMEKNKPKCPTCGSTNIKKISTSSKVFGAAMFGLFSKTAHSQFECQNCHYKW